MSYAARDDRYDLTQRDVDRAEQIGVEAATSDAVTVMAEALVRIAAPIWGWGDGAGGEVFRIIAEAALTEGMAPAGTESPVRSLVQALARRDGWLCAYCDVPLGWGHPLVTRPEMDHVVPRCQGGSGRLDNLVLSCRPCNQAKGGRTVEEWRAAR